MTGGSPFGFGFGLAPMPMPGPVDADPGQMQLDDEQRRAIVSRLLGSQMFHPGNGPAVMDAFGDQGQDQGPGQGGGQAPTPAPAQDSSGPGLNSPLASALGGALPSMLGGQMPAPQMPAPPQQQDGPATAPASIPSMIGSAFPQMSVLGGGPQAAAPQATGAIPQAGPRAAPQAAAPVSSEDDEAAPQVAQASPAARAVPTPPVQPSDLTSVGALSRVDGFDPLTGQPVSGSPRPLRGDFDPLTGQPVSGSPRPAQATSPQAAPSTAPASSDGNPISGLLSGLSRPGVSEGLLALGAGILQGKNFGEGLGQGLQNMLAVSQRQGAGDAQRLEYALKLQKAQQEQAGQNLTAQRLIQLGEDPENVRAAIGASVAGRPEALQNMLNNRFRKTPDAPSGYRQTDGGGLEPIAGGPADLKRIEDEARAREKDETQTPLTTPEARAAAGISADDDRAAWKDPNGKITFTDGPKETALIREWQQAKRENGYTGTLQQYRQEQQGPRFITVKGPNGETVTKRYNPQTGQAEDIPGAAPPAADNSGIPPGVDPGTYRKESAKAAVAEQKADNQRAQQANMAMPILERAEKAYKALADAKAIGPYQASRLNRAIGGAMGADVEVQRQEYEAAAKELELTKAQIQMKGQGSVTENERAILRMTLPRLDAASPETGLNTLRGMREQFMKAASAGRGHAAAQQGSGQQQGAGPSQGGQQQAPQANAAASRYQQLRRGGMSQADAYSRMAQEGY